MKLKSYFAGTVEAAMSLAGKELGEDAMLVYSREATAETRYLGRYEVVFALPEPAARPIAPKAEPAPISTGNAIPDSRPEPKPELKSEPKSEPSPALEHVFQEMTVLRSQLEMLSSQLRLPKAACLDERLIPGPAKPTAWVLAASRCLQAAEVAPELIDGVVEAAGRRVTADPSVPMDAALRAEVAARVRVDARTGRAEQGSAVVVLVGPPGAGKTTSIVKIAARHLYETRRPPALVSFDNYRIGGAEQLRTFASLLSAPFQAVETPAALLASLPSLSSHDLILIDTSGYSDKDMDAAEDLERFLIDCPAAEVHLTLSATTKPADLRRAVERFAHFRPTRLVFTRLDETSSFGPIWSESVRQGWPLSFFSEGQQIPEDLRVADADWLAARVVGDSIVLPAPGFAPARMSTGVEPGEQSPQWLAGSFLPLQKPVWTGVSAG